ncbi:MAG: Hsp20/alpha crystallin family protein [Candidatus Magasanikbacteria bacterium]
MSIIRYNPMWDPFAEMEEMLNRRAFSPAMDVYETDKAVVVESPLAGINPDDVKITVEKGVLTIQGESKKEHEVDEKNYYRKEVRSGAFFRQVALPAPVVEDKVSAEFEDGVLKITCPKAPASVSKQINVKVVKKAKK